MKKFLLFVMMCVCVSIGAWAEQGISKNTGTCVDGNAVIVTIDQTNHGQLGLDYITDNNAVMLKIVGQMDENDIEWLNSSDLNVATIDLQDAYLNASKDVFTITNPNVKNLILPNDWTKAQVKAAGLALSTSPNFDAAISMSAGNATLNVTGGTEPSLVAYINHPGTLRNALSHNYCSKKQGNQQITMDNKIIGEGGYCGSLRKLIVMGNTCAKDISRAGVYDANGHYVTNGTSDENSQTFNTNTDGGKYYAGLVDGATLVDGGIAGCHNLFVIDLKDAYVPNEYCDDVVVGFNGVSVVQNLREVWMPEDSRFKTVPADYLNMQSDDLHQVCIPGNIETIKTRAFAAQGRINYIWTTGPEGNTKYDNGAAFVTGSSVSDAVTTVKFMDLRHDEDDEEWVAFNNPADYNNFQYGTITLPANLKLIERFAFAGCTSVSDVYVLNATAPECHVDAFSTNQYDANNTVAPGYVKDGIVTRDAYRQGDFKEFKFMTILHYPVATTDPDIQRYTDPTREYSIATGERDDKGNTIYFPNHSEVSFAYLQGSYGYVWKAWNDDRNWYDQSLKQGYGSGWPLDKASHVATSDGTRWQNEANTLWKNNPYTDAKKDRSFYDVTTGSYNQTGEVTAPAGLDPYYNTIWNDHQLYPQPEKVGVTDDQGHPVMETVPVRDANGNIIYDGPIEGATYEGNYVKYEVDVYPENPEGLYCHSLTPDNNGQWTIGYTYTKDANGAWVKAHWDATGSTWTDYKDYMANQYPGIQRYKRELSGFVPFTDQHGQPRFNIGDDYVLYSSVTSEYKTLLTRYDKAVGYEYREATSADEGPFYTMQTQEVQKQLVTKQNDYRGWHQFVLTGYSANTIVPYEYLRSFISDNEWWTICEPFDLRYNDMVMFFGTQRNGFNPEIPYLSKLTYVVRDVENRKITLMFSKNLMEYKEHMPRTSAEDPIVSLDAYNKLNPNDKRRHGVIADDVKWTAEELAEDPIILHAGVPYLIKPHMMFMEGTTTYNRQFSIAKRDNPDLFRRLKEAEEIPGHQQMDMIYDGEYTVPTYVVGYSAADAATEGTIAAGTKTITNKDGSSFTYKDSQNGGTLTYGGETNVPYKISNDYTYSFVGSYYKSVMPQYCYFLGWDSQKNKAAFWYARTQDKSGWNWNNETGIIIPNWIDLTGDVRKIHEATSIADPARWTITNAQGVSALKCDDFKTSGTTTAKSYTMDFGATNDFELVIENGVATSVKEIDPEDTTISVFSTDGIYLGSSVKGLKKGLYIVNGKKYVVK